MAESNPDVRLEIAHVLFIDIVGSSKLLINEQSDVLGRGLDRRDEAISLLNAACDDRDVWVTLLKVDPRWNTLRSDPRFGAILKRVGLE